MIEQQSLEANWDAVAQAVRERWSGLDPSEIQSLRRNPDELVDHPGRAGALADHRRRACDPRATGPDIDGGLWSGHHCRHNRRASNEDPLVIFTAKPDRESFMDTEREGTATTFREYSDWGRRQLNESLEEHPFPAVLIAFGLGVGLGLAIGGALADALSVADAEVWTA